MCIRDRYVSYFILRSCSPFSSRTACLLASFFFVWCFIFLCDDNICLFYTFVWKISVKLNQQGFHRQLENHERFYLDCIIFLYNLYLKAQTRHMLAWIHKKEINSQRIGTSWPRHLMGALKATRMIYFFYMVELQEAEMP